MSTAASSADSILNLIYRALAWADVAENDTSAPAAVLDIALHTAAPATSAQTSNEATYTNYARVTVTRGAGGWTLSAGSGTSNVALIQFPVCGASGNTITHVSVGISGTIIHYGELAAPRAISSGIQPQFAPSALVSTMT